MHQQHHYNQRGHTPPSAKLPHEQTSYKIFVGGLDVNTKEDDLANYFSVFGRVIEKLIKMDVKTKRSRGFGFVGFKHPDSVDKVLLYADHYIHGKKIDCKRAMTKEAAFSLNQSLKGQCRKIFVSNIPRDFTKQDILNCFEMYGDLDDVNLMFKKKETGFCYITFGREEDARPLIEKGIVKYRGAELAVKLAIPKDQKEPDKVIPILDPLDQPRHRGSMQIHSQSMSSQSGYGSYQQGSQMPVHPAQARFRHSFEEGESYNHLSHHVQLDSHPNQMMRGGSGEYQQMPSNYIPPHHSTMSPTVHPQYQSQYYEYSSQLPPQHPTHRGSNHSAAMLAVNSPLQQQQSSPQSPLRREPTSPFPKSQNQPQTIQQHPVQQPAPAPAFEAEVFPPAFHYKGNSFGGQQGGFDLPIGLRDTHRLRVMSDQQINTHYKNFVVSGGPSTSSIFAPPDRRASGVNMVPGSPGYANDELGTIGGERERRYNMETHEPKIATQKNTNSNNQYKMNQQPANKPTQPVGEFYENDFNFKDQFLKLKPQPQGDSQSATSKPLSQGNLPTMTSQGAVGSPLPSQQKRGQGLDRGNSPSQSPQLLTSAKKQKRERVRVLEEEIKTLKDRLRTLEDQLREAYSTVDEDTEEKETTNVGAETSQLQHPQQASPSKFSPDAENQ